MNDLVPHSPQEDKRTLKKRKVPVPDSEHSDGGDTENLDESTTTASSDPVTEESSNSDNEQLPQGTNHSDTDF